MARIEQSDWLETFVAVADHGGFSHAVTAVHRSQSQVSAHVAALERALGASLFDRRHRPVELTDAGQALMPYAREVLASLDRAASVVESLSGVRRGRVVVGANPSTSAGFLPWLLKDFATEHPQVRVELSEATTTGLAEGLTSGRLHLAVRSTSAFPTPDGLTFQPLWREPYVAVVPTDHALTLEPAPLDPALLADYPLVVIARPGSWLDPDTDAVFRRWQLAPQAASWQTEQPQTLANLIKARMGVGIINSFAMEVSETTGLTMIQVGSIDDGRRVGLWHDPQRYMSSATQAVYNAILNAPFPAGTFPPAA